jgi:hypothetical protein
MRRVLPGVFVLIHRPLAVNVDRVAKVRRRPGERDWALRPSRPSTASSPSGLARRRTATWP